MVYFTITPKNASIILEEYNKDFVFLLFLPSFTKDGYPTSENDLKCCIIRSDWSRLHRIIIILLID